MGRLKINQEVRIQNKFHVVTTDIRSGKIKQEAWAHNLVLNQGFSKIIAGLQHYTDSYPFYCNMMRPGNQFYSGDVGTGAGQRFGGFIHIGVGSGLPSITRETLYGFFKGYYGSFHDSGWDATSQTGFYTLKVTIPVGEQYPGPITEIGLASYSTATFLSTHAILEDSEGQPISISPGPFDQLTLYSTNYVTLPPPPGKTGFVGGNDNFFKRVFVDNEAPVFFNGNRFKISLGRSNIFIEKTDPIVKVLVASKEYLHTSGIASFSPSSKRVDFSGIRFASVEGNHAQGVREIGFSWNGCPVFRSVLPIPGVWTGKDIEDEEVDTGDGQTKVFNLKWPDIVYESEEIYVQGRSPELQARGTDYTMSDPETSEITFAVAPASGAAITANYAVEYIPKDENHVLDISFTFSFKDANAE